MTSVTEIVSLLQLDGPQLDDLYQQADKVCRKHFGNNVHLRGVIEFSNYCHRNCNYCGIRAKSKNVKRYRMTAEEILAVCRKMEKQNMTTVVLQSGEDPYYTREVMGRIISAIKKETDLAVTLSVGERGLATYRYWQKMGMDRYLLRFETANRKLFRECHPDDDFIKRIKCLKALQKLGVQTGSGFLIGLPGETMEQLARDILYCTDLKLEMIGAGPFIPSELTPFGKAVNSFPKDIYFKTIAILRLLNPLAHIPATTAFDAISPRGRELVLKRGANVFMPNTTPLEYRKHYQLYPGKPCLNESADQCAVCVVKRLGAIGKKPGRGPGHAISGKPA
ncbi:MAG: [FeFe] hydrogenase H-cluster radical SAM maturase HydE [Candidatus Margulisiibacteriota bacterium]|jgi:biotin synthase